jgi:hypothetical protein
MISRRVHGQIYPLVFLLLTQLHLVFQIFIYQFSRYKSTRTSLFFLAFRMPLRCPRVDHISKIWQIIVNLLIALSLVFRPFSLSSSALIHFSLGFLLKKKNIFLRQYKHSYYCCFIYCFSFRCPPGLNTDLHLQRVECCYDQCACPSDSPSRFTAVSVFPKVNLLCQHSTSTPIFSSLVE